ncbi:MAG TPA: hypothetical protein VFA27_16050 [Vicinamibacterales bacterium]|nr:hypothetical protein [Vicinamibacterales bacterium]
MRRSTQRDAVLRAVAIVAALYGVYTLLYVPPLVVGAPAPLVLLVVAAEAICALAAAVGLWRRAAWAPAAIVAWGAAFVFAQLVEGPVLGLIANLRAVAAGAAALVLALVVAAYARGDLVTE